MAGSLFEQSYADLYETRLIEHHSDSSKLLAAVQKTKLEISNRGLIPSEFFVLVREEEKSISVSIFHEKGKALEESGYVGTGNIGGHDQVCEFEVEPLRLKHCLYFQ